MRTTSAVAGRLPIVATLGCAAVVALAGCAVAHAPGKQGTSNPTATTRSVPGPMSLSPKARANADVAAIIKAFVPPPGARQVSHVSTATLQHAIAPTPASPDVVTRTTWWLAPGDPQHLLAWEKGHLPKQFRLYGTGTLGSAIYDNDYSLPNVGAVLTQRDLSVATASAGQGRTAIRVDALSEWLPQLTTADQLPVSVSAVTFVENLGMNAHGKRPPAPATIVSKAKTREIVALINGQKLFPPGTYNCPMDDAQSLTLTFRDGESVVAVAQLATSGCQAIDTSVGGKTKPARGPAVGRDVAAKALKIAGLNWKLPTFG
jgi:hypothetical protein